MPLGGEQKLEVLESLNRIKGYIQKLISSDIKLRQIPKLSFVIDTTFEYAHKNHDWKILSKQLLSKFTTLL